MGYFMDSLTNLESALGSGLSGDTAMGFLSDLQTQRAVKRDARMEAMQARKAMRQGNKMQSMLLGAQQMGLPMGDILTEAGKASSVTGMPTTPNFLGGLIGTWPQEQQEIDLPQFDTSPLIDVQTRRAIEADVMEAVQLGQPINQVRLELLQQLQGGTEGTLYKQPEVAESVDLLIQRAYERLLRGQ